MTTHDNYTKFSSTFRYIQQLKKYMIFIFLLPLIEYSLDAEIMQRLIHTTVLELALSVQ